MVDDALVRRMFLRLLELHLAQGALVTAMALVLKDRDPTFETEVGAEVQKLSARNEATLKLFEQARTDDWMRMLAKIDGPAQ